MFFVAFFLSQNPKIQSNINYLVDIFKGEQPQKIDTRIYIWQDALALIKEAPIFGYGIGDSFDEMQNIHELNHGKLLRNFNSHNQFFEVWLASGIFSVILFFLALYFPLLDAIKSKDRILFLFMGIMIINFLVESMLFTIAGVSFFALFYSLLWVYPYSQKEQNKLNKE